VSATRGVSATAKAKEPKEEPMTKEKRWNQECQKRLGQLPFAIVTKHNDASTVAIPDTSVAYNGYTSWLEFKRLKNNETVHDQLDPRQLIFAVGLETATHGRCWIIAFRKTKWSDETLVYRPSKLRHGNVPTPISKFEDPMVRLARDGVVALDGIAYDFIVQLVRRTHGV
jgi:hypothetical protein